MLSKLGGKYDYTLAEGKDKGSEKEEERASQRRLNRMRCHFFGAQGDARTFYSSI